MGQEDIAIRRRSLLGWEFWPQFSADDTDNERSVEPDLFLQFEKLDLLIEAKLPDNQQHSDQWGNEIRSYVNEHGERGKSLYLMALGGMGNRRHSPRHQETERLPLPMPADEEREEGQDASSRQIQTEAPIIKCSWQRLLEAIDRADKRLERVLHWPLYAVKGHRTILHDLIYLFGFYGHYTTGEFLELMPRWSITMPESIAAGARLFGMSRRSNDMLLAWMPVAYSIEETSIENVRYWMTRGGYNGQNNG